MLHILDESGCRCLANREAPSSVLAVRWRAGELRERLPFASAVAVADKLDAYRAAGVQRVLLCPVADELEQFNRFAGEVIPQLAAWCDAVLRAVTRCCR
jgi:hypothetical protein